MMSSLISAGSKVGRAFSVVSLIPSLFLVVVTWVVFASGAATGAPDPTRLLSAINNVSVGTVAAGLLSTFVVGYVLHPVQFVLTQLLEGYWGTSAIGQAMMVRGIRIARRKQWHLKHAADAAGRRLSNIPPARRQSLKGVAQVPDLVMQQQLSKSLGDLPINPERVMPTRLGNVLRRHEDLAGRPYGLPGVEVVPALSLVADGERQAYLSETSEQLDVAVSVCIVTGFASIIVAASTLTDGWWVLTALVPYVLSLIAYRGAVSVAHAYGIAMRRIIDLDRFSLYKSLHLPLPATSHDELEVLAPEVAAILNGSRVSTTYMHSAS